MSLDKVGKRTPRFFTESSVLDGGGPGIPGVSYKNPHLFYQDLESLPVAERGEGIYIFDTEGKRYLDGCSGAIAANLGHGNERLKQAAIEQLDKIAFTYRLQFANQPANDLAELLVQLSPPELNRVFFVNSGSEAVEAAIKLARQFWYSTGRRGKSTIIGTRPSYHGATLGALAVTDYSPLNKPFRPLTVHSPKTASPFCYHCPLNKQFPSCEVACAQELRERIDIIGADEIAAFIIEPIGGATTGAAVPPDDYFPIVEQICHENEILLIVDDVMMGCGRTGTFFGFEHWDFTPDIVATSKGLSGGYAPIGAIIASSTIVDPVIEGGGFMHGHTFAGNPLSTAIALAAVREILDRDLVENAREVGTYLHERLHELKDRHVMIGDIRGRGLIAGVEFVQNRDAREPFPANWFVALACTRLARVHGLLVYPRRSVNGLYGDHVLIAPPLIIDSAGVDELIELFERTLQDLEGMLAGHIEPAAASFVDDTVSRYEQPEDRPAYALGDLSGVDEAGDANVTAVMDGAQYAQGDEDGEEEVASPDSEEAE